MPTNIFNEIAPSWYNFRHWSIFREELETLSHRWHKGKLLNIGCAHGPDFLAFRQEFDLYGIDSAPEMLRLARKYARKFDFPVSLSLADATRLPFKNEAFDWAISVATYHHLKSTRDRQAALIELRRVLKPHGEALITVWNHGQPRFWFHPREVMVPWQSKEKTLQRYYYLFTYHEIENLVKQTGFQLLRSFPENSYRFPIKFFSRNICLLIKKK